MFGGFALICINISAMYALLIRLLLSASAIMAGCSCCVAGSSHVAANATDNDSVGVSLHPAIRRQYAVHMQTNTTEDGTTVLLRSLMGRELGEDYYVGVTAEHAWRPLENYGDFDCKIRIYDPRVGLSLKYSF